MGQNETLMRQEAGQAGLVVARQRIENATLMQELGALLRARPPRLVITCARGSSDHAASFAKYAIETRTGTLVASHALRPPASMGRLLVDWTARCFWQFPSLAKVPTYCPLLLPLRKLARLWSLCSMTQKARRLASPTW